MATAHRLEIPDFGWLNPRTNTKRHQLTFSGQLLRVLIKIINEFVGQQAMDFFEVNSARLSWQIFFGNKAV